MSEGITKPSEIWLFNFPEAQDTFTEKEINIETMQIL